MESNHLILALGKTLPESVLQGAAVYLLLQILFLSDKNSSPNMRFNLLFASSLLLMLGFLVTFFYHDRQLANASFNTVLLGNGNPNHVQTVLTKPNLRLQFSFWTNHYANLITGFYLIGLSFCMLKLVFGLINISWFRSNKNLKLDHNLTRISQHLNSNFRLIKTVSVFLSEQIQVPMTIGFIKPIIVFPIALINQLSAAQTEAILLHELAHIKRNDYLLNIILGIMRAFLFFNPAIWLMEREINKYREQCCDDLVIDNTTDKLAYAHALLLVEENRASQLTFALSSNGKKFNLLDRIKRMIDMKNNEPSPQNKLIVLLFALITIGVTVAWNMPVKKAPKSHTIYKLKIEETYPDGRKKTISADTVELLKSSKQNKFRLYTNNITYKPTQSNTRFKFSGNRLVYNLAADTLINSKSKFKIVMEDSLGNKKEYNSIEELPADARKEFLKENNQANRIPNLNFRTPDSNLVVYNFSNKLYSNPDWKKQAEEMRKQGEALGKYYNSPQFKKQIEKLTQQSKELAEQARKQFDNPKFKKQMEQLRKQGEKMHLYYNSPVWRKQELLMRKQVDSARLNWKKSMDLQPIPAEPTKPNQPPVAPPDL